VPLGIAARVVAKAVRAAAVLGHMASTVDTYTTNIFDL
jgi:hypothetical protein